MWLLVVGCVAGVSAGLLAGLVVGWCILICVVVADPLVVLVVLVVVVWWVLGDVEPPLIEVSPVECGMFIHCAGGAAAPPACARAAESWND